MRIFRHLISWALALFLVAMFIQSTIAPLPDPPEGSVKLFDAPGQNIVFQTIAERSGVSLFEPAGRFVIAIIELVAAFFLLLPFSRRFGAALSALVCGAAIGFHLSPWLGRNRVRSSSGMRCRMSWSARNRRPGSPMRVVRTGH